MKNLNTFKIYQFCLFMLISVMATAQVYVKHDAAGTNDGSSWDNAYTDLQSALTTTASGEIWIAAGTYSPEYVDTNSTFRIGSPISLFGGFAGDEISIDDRDIFANVTILSGDTNGDDLQGNTTSNRTDNTRHIVYVDSLIQGTTSFDGITFSGGHTSDDGDVTLWHRAGGGIFSYSPLNIHQCNFSDNYARSGSGVYVIGAGATTSCTNSNFLSNRCTSQGGGFMANNVDGVTIEGCNFTNNTTVRGALYPLRCNNVTITDCDFLSNTNASGFGGALFNYNSQNVTITDCNFLQNSAGNAGAMYHDGRELDNEAEDNLLMQNCTFEQNTGTNATGAFQNWQGSITIKDCVFRNNMSGGSGGHMSLSAPNETVTISDCSFENGITGTMGNSWGGAHTCYGENGNYIISNCTYINNSCTHQGGALYGGFRANLSVDNCFFESNSVLTFNGGAVGIQNDSTSIVITNSTFLSNKAFDGSGGAVYLGPSNISSIDNCYFELNEADFGAAIHMGESNDEPEDEFSNLTLSNSVFNFNVAANQAGAVNLSNANSTIYSCVFTNNVASGSGNGGAISNNASANEVVTMDILNCTFADNLSGFVAGIAEWVDAGGASTTTIQNNIFRQDGGVNYGIELGDPLLISNGGNMLDDDSIEDVMIGSDFFGDDPKFRDIDEGDYHLLEGSPCIDAGVDNGAPEFDIEGTPRLNAVEVGAYEYYPGINSTKETILDNNGALKLFPNPVRTSSTIELDNSWRGNLELTIYDILGKVVFKQSLNKVSEIYKETIDLSDLRNGVYDVLISNGSEAVVQKITKF